MGGMRLGGKLEKKKKSKGRWLRACSTLLLVEPREIRLRSNVLASVLPFGTSRNDRNTGLALGGCVFFLFFSRVLLLIASDRTVGID